MKNKWYNNIDFCGMCVNSLFVGVIWNNFCEYSIYWNIFIIIRIWGGFVIIDVIFDKMYY